MNEIRAELDHLEEDLEAFIRERVEPALARDLDARLGERAREIATRNEAQLREAVARADGQTAAQARDLRALTQAVTELRADLARMADRVARLEKRATARDDAPRAGEPRALAVAPQRPVQVYRQPEPTRRGGRSLSELIRDNIEYVTIGAVGLVVVVVVGWIVSSFNPPAKSPPTDAPPAATASPAIAPAATVAEAAASPVVAPPGPTDLGLTELAKRSDVVRKLCAAPRTCAFADLWPVLAPAERQTLVTAAAEQVARPCLAKGAHPPVGLDANWRSALTCAHAKASASLTTDRDEETAARWLLSWIGAHP
jgi:uncharacterized coiled-coil protein SlyX